ncbi:TPA: tetratricopeptide repeat protein [Staphylococcus aureus]|nr:tetratricopeptide repeat protein [Staphylococcus aureus]
MAQKNNNVFPMTFDDAFYRKMAKQKFKQREYKRAAEYFEKVLELSPDDLEIQIDYAQCLVQLGIAKKAEHLFYDNIIYNRHLEDSFYELSQLNIEVNEPNKAFLFGINYVIVSDDQDYRDELDQMFDVKYQSEEQIELEAQLFVVQILFQYLFSQGRLKDAKNYVLHQPQEVQDHRVVRNLLAMCYLYLGEYDTAKALYEALLQEDSTDIYALCHYTLLLYNTKENEQYQKYLKILNKVVPMNDDESFKLGIVLSYLKQYRASQQLLYPLYKKGKFLSIQMYNALAYNYYYLGEEDESHYYWDKLKQISKVEIGHAPWVIENSKEVFDQHILPLLQSDDSHYRLYGIFLLDQLNGKEIVMTESIWQVLENLNNYEKLYLTYLVQGLTLNKLDFIHRGLLTLYQNELFVSENDLMVAWINQGELIIAEKVDLTDVEPYIGAFIYLYFKNQPRNVTKKQITTWLGITQYKLNKMIEFLLSI